MNDERFMIGPGDYITIKKKSWHAVKVTSEEPLKVLSVQAPEFLGNDRKYKHL
jgi:mannose-6-phosphate isomerase-like protein (cupin superfamily)